MKLINYNINNINTLIYFIGKYEPAIKNTIYNFVIYYKIKEYIIKYLKQKYNEFRIIHSKYKKSDESLSCIFYKYNHVQLYSKSLNYNQQMLNIFTNKTHLISLPLSKINFNYKDKLNCLNFIFNSHKIDNLLIIVSFTKKKKYIYMDKCLAIIHIDKNILHDNDNKL